MSFYRGRLYTVEDLQRLTFVKTYKQELKIYEIELIEDRVPTPFEIEHNLIQFANATILYAIGHFKNDFITEKEFNLIYDKIVTYMDNVEFLGYQKVYTKITKEINIDMLHIKPFMVYM